MNSLEKQVRAIETVSERPVVAVTVNHEGLTPDEVQEECRNIHERLGIPAVDVLLDGASSLLEAVLPREVEARG